MKNKNHPISSYDENLCLVPDVTMWIIFLFLLRPYVVLVISFVNKKDRMQFINLLYSDKLMMSLGALIAIPTVLIIYAWTKRQPGATTFVMAIWKRGRELMAVSAALNACLVFIPLWMGTINKITLHGWLQFAASIIILLTVLKSEYIKDCFADFPEEIKK